jgi:hypothetical protein
MTMGGQHASEGDAFSAFGWGLRHYGWVLAVTTVLLGVLVPEVLHRSASDRYDAQAQVGPVSAVTIPNMDALPRSGETVFGNGAVEDAVRQELRLGSTTVVVPDYVELVAPQDNLVFSIIGHGESAQAAANAANAAAGAFTEELNKYEDPIGTFAVQRSAAVPARAVSTVSWPPLVLAGIAAGLLVGLGVIGVLLAVRRPVLSPAAAGRVTGAPVLAGIEHRPGREEVPGLPQLCHSLLTSDVNVVFLTGPESATHDRLRLASQLRKAMQGLPTEKAGTTLNHPRIVERPSPAELATRSENSLTLLVVPVGTGLGALARHAEQHLHAGSTGVVFVRHTGALRHSLRRLAGVGSLVTNRA